MRLPLNRKIFQYLSKVKKHPKRIAFVVTTATLVLLGGVIVKNVYVADKQEQVEVTPTPKEPSEKALKIAAFAMARVSESKKVELKTRYGLENFDDTQFIREWALIMDSDPALLAKNEALMEKTITQENQPVYYYEQTTTNPVINNDDIQDQIDKQQSELEDLQSDLRWECIQNGGVPMGNKCM